MSASTEFQDTNTAISRPGADGVVRVGVDDGMLTRPIGELLTGGDGLAGGLARNDALLPDGSPSGGAAGEAGYAVNGAVTTHNGTSGADVFLFSPDLEPLGAGLRPETDLGPIRRDLVPDFTDGLDRFDLSGYRHASPDGQPPVFLGSEPFVASLALQIRVLIEGDHTLVQFAAPFGAPTEGVPPAVPVMPTGEIELPGIHHFTAADFILG